MFQVVQLGISILDLEKIASILEASGYKLMAQNFGCDDGDYTEVLPEDWNENFDPTEFSWQIW